MFVQASSRSLLLLRRGLCGPSSSKLVPLLLRSLSTTATTTTTTNKNNQNYDDDSNVIRWGILSAGRIASDYCQAIQMTSGAKVEAVAAQNLDRAQQFGHKFAAENAYGNYDDLLNDQNVDVVYIGSIADQHYPLARACLEAGKPVVVEKPLTLCYDDTKRLIDLARKKNNVFLMEGMWTRCFPATRKIRELISNGVIGRPVMVQADFGWSTKDCGPEDRIWSTESGGMILDIGMYLAQWGPIIFGRDAIVNNVQAMGNMKNGVDHTALVSCQYASSSSSSPVGFMQFYVTGDANTEERVSIQGTHGRIVVESPAHTPSKIRVQLDTGRGGGGGSQEQVLEFPLPNDSHCSWNYPGSVGFTYQIQAVGECLRQGLKQCPDFTWEDSLHVADLLDDVRNRLLDDDTDSSSNSSNRSSSSFQ